MTDRPRVLVSWSSGKDSAWMLSRLKQDPGLELVGLLTTFNEEADRVAMHAVRRALAEAQAAAADLPLWAVDLPWPCSNEDYEARMRVAVDRARAEGVTHMAFGDLFLEDIRGYREEKLAGTGLEPLFPLWLGAGEAGRGATPALAREMVAGGLEAVLTCVDPKQLDPAFVGRRYDAALLDELPEGVDPCGENGEFHTFCTTAPAFGKRVEVTAGEVVERGGFVYADVLPAG